MSEPKTNEVTTTYNPDDQEVVNKKKSSFPISCVGVLNMKNTSKKNRSEMDIVEKMAVLSVGASRLFVEIKNRAKRTTNIAELIKPKNKVERNSRGKAVKELVDEDMICKAGVRRFMINPTLIVPSRERREQAVEKWQSLTGADPGETEDEAEERYEDEFLEWCNRPTYED